MALVDPNTLLTPVQPWQTPGLNPFVGTWRLISCTAYRSKGRVLALYGKHPHGMLTYDAAGNMSVQIMRAGRPLLRAQHKLRATPAELGAAFHGYEAYFGTYHVDWAAGLVHHRVLGALFPNWTGTVQSRRFQFAGPNRLNLVLEPLPPRERDSSDHSGLPPHEQHGSAPGDLPRGTRVVLAWERVY